MAGMGFGFNEGFNFVASWALPTAQHHEIARGPAALDPSMGNV